MSQNSSTQPVESTNSAYNFVPLSDLVHQPVGAERISHDLPFKDGLCGSLDLSLESVTPLLVGGERIKRGDNTPTEVRFCQTQHGYTIPGSSLKGLLRSVIETVSFGRMQAVDDRRYGLRDISGKKVSGSYMAHFQGANGTRVKAGWLQKNAQGQPMLTPCDYAFLAHADLHQYLYGRPEKGERAELFPTAGKFLRRELRTPQLDRLPQRTVKLKYAMWQAHCRAAGQPSDTISFTEATPSTDKKRQMTRVPIARGLGSSNGLRGVPVFTGQVSDRNPKNPYKKHDFVFYNQRESEQMPVSQGDWRDFRFVNGDDPSHVEASREAAKDLSWPGYWKERYDLGEAVPVFYLQDGHNLRMGPAFMFKLASHYSTHDSVRAVNPAHLGAPNSAQDGYDLAEQLFGTAGADQTAALAARVACESAFAPLASTSVENNLRATVLGAPKPSYFPHYLVQTRAPVQEYTTWLGAKGGTQPPQIRGWKRYPARPANQVEQPPKAPDGISQRVQSTLRPVSAGTRFQARIRFHNLRPYELGALLWAIQLKGQNHVHSLGMGKNCGFGQVRLHLDSNSLRLRPNNRRSSAPTLDDCRQAFLSHMDDVYGAHAQKPWSESPQRQLFDAMTNPEADTFPGELRHPKLGMGKGNNEFVTAKQAGMTLAEYDSSVSQPHPIIRAIPPKPSPGIEAMAAPAAPPSAPPPQAKTSDWTLAILKLIDPGAPVYEIHLGSEAITQRDDDARKLQEMLSKEQKDELKKRRKKGKGIAVDVRTERLGARVVVTELRAPQTP